MKFRNKYERIKIETNPGSPIKYEYGSKLDKEKNVVIEKKGEINLYAYINSFADSVDINVLINRFTNGDKEALSQRAGFYVDIDNIPTNFNDFIDYSRQAQSFFDTLPVDIKQQFNNNFEMFLSQAGDSQWRKLLDTSEDDIRRQKDDMTREIAAMNKQSIKADSVIQNPGIDSVKLEEQEIRK